MTEKRFIISKNVGNRFPTGIIDTKEQQLLWVEQVVDCLNEQQSTISALKEENEYFRKSRDKWKTKALQKDEQLKDCDNDCFNCRFYNKVCDFCTKFHIYTMTTGDGV